MLRFYSGRDFVEVGGLMSYGTGLYVGLSARSYEQGSSVVIEQDEFCPWNTGRWCVGADGVGRTENGPDLRCSVSDLGSVYLGGFTWNRLSQALRVEELTPGAAGRADAIFRTACAAWCHEIF
jgi:Sterol carrier protein domain